MPPVPIIALNDGREIPQLGFGVFQIPPRDTERAVEAALAIGYRHIDSAEMYGNEGGVGAAVRASALDREDLFLTSKLNNGFHRPDDARRAMDQTLSEVGFDSRRPVSDPLAVADALRRRLRVDVEDDGGVPPRRPGSLDRSLGLPGSSICSA
jgi:aryl-alcohol dehydrogenase-like predicted oxidoreductase